MMQGQITERGRFYRISGCDGKERFASWKEAEKVSGRRRKQKRHGSRQVYRCRFCQGFHVGSKP